MRIPIYQIDAFTDRVFHGNPAAVCPLGAWLTEDQMQAIAAENNFSETAFFVDHGDGYELRWFTPTTEVDLCGHATLASAYVILNILEPSRDKVNFVTKSGKLEVTRTDDLLALDFPARPAEPLAAEPKLTEALGQPPYEVLAARDLLVVFETEEQIQDLKPDFGRIVELERSGVIVTAPGNEADFVSRFFAPALGVPEDPVTGSAHCTLVPYWAKRLGKKKLFARQISRRGGELYCEDRGERVRIAGRAVRFLEGSIYVD